MPLQREKLWHVNSFELYPATAIKIVSMRGALLVVLWLGAAAALGVLGFAIYEVKRTPPVRAVPDVDRLPARQPHNSLSRWTVTEHLSAHHVLIAQVETDHLNEAVAIAQQLVEPLKSKYTEVLIYYHRPGRPDTLPPRRVQWTPTGGYRETVYEQN
jgi:hypothetical protein